MTSITNTRIVPWVVRTYMDTHGWLKTDQKSQRTTDRVTYVCSACVAVAKTEFEPQSRPSQTTAAASSIEQVAMDVSAPINGNCSSF